jgi:hypothetical protein
MIGYHIHGDNTITPLTFLPEYNRQGVEWKKLKKLGGVN